MMTMRVNFGGPGQSQSRLVGDYILGPRIGSGSFAVIWRSRHRQHGLEVAVKEIDKKLLSYKVSENLLKEISILSTINHPNIIQLFEAIETEDRIFLVLEYCGGGDLAAYINRQGKVSEEIARHFMRQLPAGLQVLQEKHLIHRDLKPQNLLLSTNGATPQLKIGDFGFARSLTPEDLAATLCGSPLYMSPEIIQNEKYDAKADLRSVGAILFQLVTGKPPFNGNNQLQLFQNILRSTELQFLEGVVQELHPDCVDLCRSLLRHNPVERLTFREFFNHKFLGETSKKVDVELDASSLQAMTGQFGSSVKKSHLPSGDLIEASSRNKKSASSSGSGMVSRTREYGCSSGEKGAHGAMPFVVCGNKEKSVHNQCSSDQLRGDSMDSIEKEYVLVNPHSASMETFSYYPETSLQDYSTLKCQAKKSDQESAVSLETKETAESSAGSAKIPQFQGSDPRTLSSTESAILREVQKLNILHPSTRLQLLRQYAQPIAELAQEKYNAGLFLESFSIELLVLAIWKKALQICGSWITSAPDNESHGSSSANQPTTNVWGNADLGPNSEYTVGLNTPSSACIWAEQGFIVACDRTEKLQCHLQDMDATAEMPDAMKIIYQTALTIGRSGAVDEYMRNKGSAAASYSKAMLLLSFIIGEAESLPLNPSFSLTPANKKRIQTYINNLQTHQSQFLTSAPFPKLSTDFQTK
ncbi:serine/threonine-protein kinase ATG1a-like isoform X2 [Hibiscus syriacus]|uniref:serine/threonine-protein kinase ATG1a-like isoform X2 n=1 Tax=Hibiscus syriacus TaxID=106335 RepID=UPI0019213C4E|nr:serine/threonine-protein kinase ATG1a-like isoform X2 [Hibiscus syriacus]